MFKVLNKVHCSFVGSSTGLDPWSPCSSNTSLSTGRSYSDVAVLTVATLTKPLSSGLICTTLAILQWFRDVLSSAISTTSFTIRFLCSLHHLVLGCNVCRNSFRHLVQNTLTRYCTLRHLLRKYMSSLWKFPGGGSTILDFMVKIWLGSKVTSHWGRWTL